MIREAEKTVAAVQKRLPLEIRTLARAVPVIYYDWPTEDILGADFEPDILGMFVGEPVSGEPGAANAVPPHILLFLENILDEAEGDAARFREEVRITYLHELGHYLGWGEEEVEARGLG
jgi:predicted Zn-dependent protease with MMP-like domain